MALAAPKVLCKAKRQSRAQCSMFKVQSYEKGYLEIHHSDSSSHLDRHRHQPGSHQLHLLRKGAHPLPLPRGGGLRRRGATPSPSIREGNWERGWAQSLILFLCIFSTADSIQQHAYHLSGTSPELQPQLWSSLQLEVVNGLKFVNYICFHARFSVWWHYMNR